MPAENRASRLRTGKVPAGVSTPAVVGSKPAAATRQRSPWRPLNAKQVRSSETEVGRAGTRRTRCGSVTPDVQRRPVDRVRAASATRVRRTRSAPTTSTLAGRHNDSDDLPKIAPDRDETQPAERPQSGLPRPVVPVHSTKQTTSDDKATARVARAVKLAWKHISKVGGSRVRGAGFLPLLAALLFIVVAIIAGCVYTYTDTTPVPAESSSQSDRDWKKWLTEVA